MTTKKKLLFALVFISIVDLYAQINIDHARYQRLFLEGQCDSLIRETKKIRTSKEYGKNWMIDYYIAMGLCCKGNTNLAQKGFNYIINEYPQNQRIRTLLTESRKGCAPTSTSTNYLALAKFIVSNNWQGGGSEPSVVKGKLGYVLNCNQDVELYKFNPDFDQSELQKRLFHVDEVEKALSYYTNFLPMSKYNISSSGRYIFITPNNKSLNDNSVKKNCY